MTAAQQQQTPPGQELVVPVAQSRRDRAEEAYRQLREAAGQITGSPPAPQRILRLDCRLGGRNSRIEVGRPDPIQGHVVLAIFDVGGERPWVIYTTRDIRAPAFRLGRSVKAVTAFA